ncbi:embryo-specific protein ATS3A-like isoform X2 [Vicia villosa]|uniref:embryo-specific protein ATS3A-like isoform X2 n=1 Tax=Vicia villosa TaxID=3911 RepID=UPI00273A7FC0|nr:embryo-specific protein ATS3A-like isoform X2 [Vicia villosa]
MKVFTLILTFSIIIAFSHATPTLVTQLQLQLNQSSMLNHTEEQINEARLMSGRGRGRYVDCSYLITIKTSCDSPRNSKDHIGLLFGDSLDSEIYVPRLDGPDSGPFRRCRTMSFDVKAPEPCMGEICKLYLFRNGTDGWMPETVTAYDYHYPPVIFNYNFFLSEGPGVGHNYCGTIRRFKDVLTEATGKLMAVVNIGRKL